MSTKLIVCKGCGETLAATTQDDGWDTEVCECPKCGYVNTNWTSKERSCKHDDQRPTDWKDIIEHLITTAGLVTAIWILFR